MAIAEETLTPTLLERKPSLQVDLETDTRWQLVQCITQTAPFVRSPRITQLLLYLTEQTLHGRGDLLNESSIARNVFGRVEEFNSAVDTIVRSHMVRLRQKLEQYASIADASDLWRLEAPRGGYALSFSRPNLNQQGSISERTAIAQPAAATKDPRLSLMVVICMALVMFCIGSIAALLTEARHRAAEQLAKPPAPHLLWSRFFGKNDHTTLVAADSALVAFHTLTDSQTTLDDYVHRNYTRYTRSLGHRERDLDDEVRDRRYTSFVDLCLARDLSLLAQSRSATLNVRYSRDLNVADLKVGNWILSGDGSANPWVTLFEPSMNFVERRDPVTRHSYMLNRKPLSGEDVAYRYSPNQGEHRVFGILALMPNLSNTGDVLIVEGTSLAGTEAVSDFLMNDAALTTFLRKIARNNNSLPHFELLLEANNLNGDSGRATILASRVYR